MIDFIDDPQFRRIVFVIEHRPAYVHMREEKRDAQVGQQDTHTWSSSELGKSIFYAGPGKCPGGFGCFFCRFSSGQLGVHHEAGIGEIGEAISRDMALTTKVLQLANSPLFSTQNQISDPKHAVALLGLGHIRPLVLSASLYSQFSVSDSQEFSIEELMDHSVTIGGLAKKVATAEAASAELIDQSMVAGMLYEIGKILLIDQIPDQYREALKVAREQGISQWEAEKEIIGASHSEIGAYLLAMWGLPAPVVEAVAFCHHPQQAEIDKFAPLVAVHVATSVRAKKDTHEATQAHLDLEFLKSRMDIDDPQSRWQEIFDAEASCCV